MKLIAREVLNDCRVAHEMLENITSETEWRIVWFSAVSLLRSVGNVLLNEDSHNPEVKPLVSEMYKRHANNKEKYAIYWDFIKRSRDQALKHYEMGFEEGAIFVAPVDQNGIVSLDDGFGLGEHNLFRPILTGYGAGEDYRDVLLEAIDWWGKELAWIETKLGGV